MEIALTTNLVRFLSIQPSSASKEDRSNPK